MVNAIIFTGHSAAVVRDTVLPRVTNGFTGSAPDLGALEVGGPVPPTDGGL